MYNFPVAQQSCLDLISQAKESFFRSDKLQLLNKALETYPDRLEPYYELMMHYHDEKKWLLAAGYSLMAPSNRETKDRPFDEKVYKVLFDMYKGVVCYWAGYYEQGHKATLDALKRVDNPIQEECLRKNLTYFEDKLDKPAISASPPSQTIIVIDNFYEEPNKIRELALGMDFPVKGNYPGYRTDSYQPEGIKEKFESIIGRGITYFPGGYNGSFQYTTKDMTSWIHRDLTDWSAIVFLSPNPPADGGTVLYRHKATGLETAANEKEEGILSRSSNRHEDWDVIDRIGNKYNRCVLFRGKNSHMSDRYFGEDKQTGRLFQTFFFNDSK